MPVEGARELVESAGVGEGGRDEGCVEGEVENAGGSSSSAVGVGAVEVGASS